jgi:hypothetical protein
MDHREPPRMAVGDRRPDGAIEDSARRFRLPPLGLDGGHRRLEHNRAGLLVVAALALFAGLIYVGSRGVRSAVSWLHHQPAYQFPFDQIQLTAEPPSWYRGARREFLDSVRKSAGEPETVPMLDELPDRLALAFKNYPWVEEVVSLSYAPGAITVDLRYRWPVAWAKLPQGQQQIVDEKAILLPAANVDPEKLGKVIKISGNSLAAPSDPRPGVIWKRKQEDTGLEQPDERIVGAAKLAGFIRRQNELSARKRVPALHILEIIVSDFRRHGLFIVNGDGGEMIWWDAPPGDEQPGRPTALEKWAMLETWRGSTSDRSLSEEDYWAFSRTGLRPVCPHGNPAHNPKESAGGRAGSPAAAKKSGGSGQ